VLSGESPGPHKIQGIGAGFVPEVLNTSVYDEIIRISSQEAAELTRSVARNDGIFVGISSGAALAAARRIAERFSGEHKRIVVILPDTGERYLSTWIFQEN
jgi:cysteine synthase A